MQKKIAFIGCGNMGQAMIGGIVRTGAALPQDIVVSDLNAASLADTHEKYGVLTIGDNCKAVENADIVVLSVKPHLYAPVIAQIADAVQASAVIVTIAAGKSISSTQQSFGRAVKVVCAMPNTPALVGAGMSAVCPSSEVSEEEFASVRTLFESFGKVARVPESMFPAVVAVSGSSPAYVYMFIEALADGAVREGMPRSMAYEMAAQAVLGSAKMVLETGLHPGVLKDMVCSPGGTTIEAVAALEKSGMRASVLDAMDACTEKVRKMSR